MMPFLMERERRSGVEEGRCWVVLCPDIRRKEKEELAPSTHRQPGRD